MFKIRLADINVLVHNRYDYVRTLCENYMTDTNSIDMEVCASQLDIENEIKNSDVKISADYAESVCIHREIAEKLAVYDAFVLHSAFVSCDGVGVAFGARSGTGKTTHISLLSKNYGKKIKVINGDKPIVRFVEGRPIGFGTPWCGKEGLGSNTSSELSVFCLLERGDNNSIKIISPEEATLPLLSQIYIPKSVKNAIKTLELIDRFCQCIKFYRFSCNMENEAAHISYDAIIGKEKKQ